MSTLAAAPLPFIAAATIFAFAFLIIVAKVVFAATDEPTRRLCAILAALRRQRPGTETARALLPERSSDFPAARNSGSSFHHHHTRGGRRSQPRIGLPRSRQEGQSTSAQSASPGNPSPRP